MIWLIGASLVVLALAGTAGYYLRQVQKLKQHQAEQLAELDRKAQKKRGEMNDSIQILAQSIGQEVNGNQLSLTEASIRISGLLKTLSVSDDVKEEFLAFYKLAEATAHIPILEEWKKLSTKKKLAFSKERDKLESDYREFVLAAAKRIQGRDF